MLPTTWQVVELWHKVFRIESISCPVLASAVLLMEANWRCQELQALSQSCSSRREPVKCSPGNDPDLTRTAGRFPQ